MLEVIEGTIKKYHLFQPHDRVLVGVSGGPDSVALLHVLWSLREKLALELHVCHLNHMLRGEESDKDALYVADLARKLDLPFTGESVDVPAVMAATGLSGEDAARQVRHAFYDRVAVRINADKIALGHNRDDQVETVLMRFLRGAGIDGLTGMQPRRGKIVRPLLEVSRQAIENYCQRFDLRPRQDRTNLEPVYLRNKIRLHLLPLLEKEYNPQIRQVLTHMAGVLHDDRAYLEECSAALLPELIAGEEPGRITVYLDQLRRQHPAIQRRVCRALLSRLQGNLTGFYGKHIEAMVRMVNHLPVGSTLNLPKNICVTRDYRYLYLQYGATCKTEESGLTPILLQIPGTTPVPEWKMTVIADLVSELPPEKPCRSGEFAFFDYERLSLPLCLRTWRPGDRFRPLGMQGSKKLQDFFTDRKVPKAERHRVPLIVSGQEIIWVVGYQIAETARVTQGTKFILVLKVNYH